ncbi:DEAD/DEAH box helicase [Demequina zhanjiangensis]|uniref:DEAD/DEAH box helicase n=1 Tax=Demequina zhanjiangensis TaxID=3051659 RepID=A0ABT8G2Z5_9MICO|nr:DEAD/DEAH box helicase [Demequina sp. SYSU T00b26]MDN4473463.1 DEAD/DEAH box helicase [Demequina sp. SYSU T00b26]
MTDTPALSLRLEPAGGFVMATASELDRERWYRIALLLADTTPASGASLRVEPARLLRERIALRGLLAELGVGLAADEAVRALLARSISDQRGFAAAFSERSDQTEVGVDDHDPGRQVVRNLRQFQIRDFERLAQLDHGANFSVPGAGKTTVTYALHARERREGRATKLLVIAPLSAFNAWEEDAETVLDPPLSVGRWRGGALPDTDVILVNYQRVTASASLLLAMMLRHRTHLVVDEAHRAKRGAAGEWGRAILSIAPFASRRDVLTGTPAPNQPRDLLAVLDIAWPGGIVRRAVPPAALRSDPSDADMHGLNGAVAPLYVRTTKNELGLRDPRIVLEPVPMGGLQQQIYDALVNRYVGSLDLGRRDAAMLSQMGEVTMYLLQAACSPRLLAANSGVPREYRYPSLAIPAGSRVAGMIDRYADHEVPAKFERALRIVENNVRLGRKTLVWSNFPDNLLDLEMMLAGLSPALVYGAIPSSDDAEPGVRTREREIDRFRNDPECWVLLANPAAMSEGISLHHWCHDAIYIDRTFNAGQYLQSLDRIHRLGLPEDTETRVTILTASSTIDDRVNSRVEDKTRRLALMLNDPALTQMALPDDDDTGDVIDDMLDLAEVMEHLRQRARRGPHDELAE